MTPLLARLSRLNPATILVAILLGVIAYVASQRYGDEQSKEVAGFVVAAVALFLRADKKADGDSAEHTNGGAVLGSAGGHRSSENPSDVLSIKRELLTAFAKGGRDVDDAAELEAELVAIAIVERAARRVPVPGSTGDDGAKKDA